MTKADSLGCINIQNVKIYPVENSDATGWSDDQT